MIRVKDIWKRYDNLQVLKGLSLQVQRGETVVILGRSGVGKSVLLRQLIGIEKPDSGLVEVNGFKISELTQNQLYRAVRNMGMLFQSAALFDSMSVGENTGFYLQQHGDPNTGISLTKKERRLRVAEALEMVDLVGTEDKMPSELSGGMRKRAALARLIAYRPRIILYDEPTTGLDPVTAMQINDLIIRTQRELSATSIVVTHDIRSALKVGDRLAFHHDGKIAYIAEKKEFLKTKDPNVQAFFDNAILTEDLLPIKRSDS